MVFSIQKLFGLFAVIWLVWTFFRFFEARQKNRSNKASDSDFDTFSDNFGAPKNEPYKSSVDLQECGICGTWFSGKTCERESCHK